MAALTLETTELAPQIWCIRIRGELDSSNLNRLKEAFDQIFARKIYRVVVNLEKARYVASSGIGCIIGGYTTAIKNGGRLVMAAVPLQVKEVLDLIGLGGVLRFAKDESAALGQFV
ncbi:MAG TPA: STAS domain-containing protein [Planctomycetota bacterium]|nr:STAS domain-containing protein [Planctomycetota bacterium]